MKNFGLRVSCLVFEVTRKCNMKCNHCLRGHAQEVDINYEIIDNVLNNITQIDNIVFTGGEPTLNIDAIRYIINKIIEKNIPCYSFFIVTNGLIYSEELVLLLIEFFAYCQEFSCESLGGLAVSIDQYHSKIQYKNLLKYKALNFYSNSKEGEFKNSLLNEGMAYENGIGVRDAIFNNKGISIEEYDENSITADTIYINSLGDVLNDSDMSYDSQEEFTLGNVLKKSLLEIIIETSDYFTNEYKAAVV